MKLLFDENLSPKLVSALIDLYPDSVHLDRLGMGGSTDDQVWEFARSEGLVIISKDSDFHEKSLLRGYPPKIIWIKRGNCSNKQIELILRNKFQQISFFYNDTDAAFLILL